MFKQEPLPDVEKRIRIWQKEDCSAPPILRRLHVHRVWLTFLNLMSLLALYDCKKHIEAQRENDFNHWNSYNLEY